MARNVARAALALAPLVVAPSAGRAQRMLLPPALEVRLPKAPTVAPLDGQRVLAYELHVTNLGAEPLTLTRLEILGEGDAAPLATLAESALAVAVTRPGVVLRGAERLRVAGGMRAVAFVWVARPADAALPRRLRHRLVVERTAGADSGARVTFDVAPAEVTQEMAALGPPLRGGPWLAANGPAPVSGHRRALIAVDGAPRIAQRFAIDYVKLGPDFRTWSGDSLKNASYAAYGVPALAVADGIVVAAKDSIPENVPGIASRAVDITRETVGGNHLIVDIGGGRYAFYAHLQPGSLRAKVGDRVRRGQELGLVGNSGNSTEPHLHFHLMDASSPLGSEGIPYVHERLDVVGRCQTFNRGCALVASDVHAREMPAANLLVRFPE